MLLLPQASGTGFMGMKIQVSWHDDAKTILLYTYLEGWTAEEFYETFAHAAHLVKESPNRLRGIFTDCTHDGMPPRAIMPGYTKAITQGKLPMILVNPHPVSRMMFECIRKAYKVQRPIYYVRSLEEAEATLSRHYKVLQVPSA
jgi:hypothetical protein